VTSVHFPPGFDAARLLEPMQSMAMETSAAYRRAVTETDPVRFALTFLPHHLSSADTGGQVSLSEFHLSMAKVARRWMRLEPRRDIWIAPRRAAKSTWQHVILPLWALAHGHRNTFMSFSHSSRQAERHMANLRRELAENDLLLGDFPELRPLRGGNGSSNSAATVQTRGGRTFATGGMDTGALGTKFGSDRIGILTLDDIEPGESNYSPAAKEKRLTTLLDDVIPMGDRNTVVSLCGTTTMHGSIIHDAVRHASGVKRAQWIVDEEFRVHYFTPIVENPDGSRASMWPAMWSLEYLEAREGTRRYAKNYLNDPSAVGDGAYWSRELFVHREIPTSRRVVSVDPAVSTLAGSDFTAIAVVGEQPGGRLWSVDFARQFKVSPAKRREVVHRLCRQNPDIREVIVEKNQGGDTWREIFEPLPGNARLTLISVSGSKTSRLDRLLDRYEKGRVVHAAPLRDLEDQLLAYPSPAAHDDLADAVENAIFHMAGR
jgi:predicted phage terminase large subunit-like protein